MSVSRRAVILEEIERWRAEGMLDDDEYVFLRSRYDQGRDPRLDSAPDATVAEEASSPSPAAYATHLVGGLLLGAAVVALIQFFVPIGGWQPLAALIVSALAMGAAVVAEMRRGALAAEAGLAAGIVAAGSVPFYAVSPALLGGIAAALAVGVALLRRGRTPLSLLATAAFFVGAQHMARVDLLAAAPAGAEGALMLSLGAFGALLVAHRRERWGGHALALHACAMTLAAFPLLDALGTTDPGVAALAVGGMLGALFLLGLQLDARPLVAVTSAMLTFAAIAFAFLALGPALAAIVLLLLGAVLVWHAETVRGYFAPSAATAPRASQA